MRSNWALGITLFISAFLSLLTVSAPWTRNLEHVVLSKTLNYSPYAYLVSQTLCEHTGESAGPDEADGVFVTPSWAFEMDAANHIWLAPFKEEGRERYLGQLQPILLDQQRTLTLLARGGIALRNHEKSVALFYWRHDPEIAGYLLYLVDITDCLEDAERLPRLSLAIRPSARGYYSLGNALAESENFAAALVAYQQGLVLSAVGKEDVLESLIYVEIGHIHRAEGRTEAARDSYERALSLREDSPEAFVGLAILDMNSGNPALAIERLKRGLALMPGDANLHYRLADAYVRLGQLDDARRILALLVQMRSDFPPGWRLLGNVASQQDDYPSALKAYKQYLELVPDDEGVRQRVTELEALSVP